MNAMDLKDMTVADLIGYLDYNLKHGAIKSGDKVFLATDEEGNSFSPVVRGGIEADKGVVILFPIKVTQELPS